MQNRERENFSQQISDYLRSLPSAEREILESQTEKEIRKERPKLGEIRKDSFIFRSFLEAAVAQQLGIDIPDTN